MKIQKPAPSEYEIDPTIARRWSPRAYDPAGAVSAAEMKRLFEAARWAPSAFNSQPWSYVYAHAGTPAFDVILDCLVPFNQGWAKNAGVLIIACNRTTDDKGRPMTHGEHDLGLSVATLMLQAESMGLITHGMSGFDRDKAKAVLGLPADWQAMTAVAVGHPGDPNLLDEKLRERELAERMPRRPVAEIAFEGTWKAE